ncbi:hypothetical protein DCS_07177 [Drechmeria coniospora]|uniref:Fungal specific transcription factor n=1 Tax=Drechmeria coniospora TaxID=98403 RepID=A0A151GDQ0_DRECN|nr:hypothetical protein DCS_07177 [Drechmeria coniospora]KYK55215.1 hypothetical protein DCS_07177 [Drechmeria coniospora]ODA82163.1 hypothetical protein RJ55_00669 [Drechmeria coniospora]
MPASGDRSTSSSAGPSSLAQGTQPRRSQQATENQPDSAAPAPDRGLPAPGQGDAIPTLDVSGAGTTVKLDALGPLVVNQDGTMSRISNWPEMSDVEKENTLRVLGKRNQARLAALRQRSHGTSVEGESNGQ